GGRRGGGGPRASLEAGRSLVYAKHSCSPVNGSFATVALRVFSQDLTPAPRCQDHTTSPSASGAFVTSAIRVHRSPSRVDDVAQRPSFGMGWRISTTDLGQAASVISDIPKS